MPNSEFEKCISSRRLRRAEGAKRFARNELREAESDLRDAQDSLGEGKNKWATVQAYYSVFHALRSLLYAAGYRERSHWCTLVGVEELYVKQRQLLTDKDLQMAHHMMNLREDADYAAAYSEDGAKEACLNAKAFIKKTKMILSTK